MNLFSISFALSLWILLFYRGGIPFLGTAFLALVAFGLWLLPWTLELYASKKSLPSPLLPVHTAFGLNKKGKAFLLGTGLLIILWGLSAAFSMAPSFGAEDTALFGGAILIFFGVLFLKPRFFNSTHWEVALLSGAFLASVPGFLWFLTEAQPRFFGSFGEAAASFNAFPNAYANFLLLALPVLVHRLFLSKGKLLWLYGFLALMLGTAFILSLSRGAWLVSLLTLLGAAVLWVWTFRARDFARQLWTQKGRILVVGLGLLIFVNGLQGLRAERFDVVTFEEKVQFQSDEGRTSTNERLSFWLGSFELMEQRLWLGFGPSTFSFAYPLIQKDFGALSGHPHNVFLKFGVEQGVLFSTLALGLTLLFFLAGLQELKVRQSPLFWGLLACLLHNLLDYNLNFASIVLVTSSGAGLLAREIFLSSGTSVRSLRTLRFQRAFLLGMTFVALGFSGLLLHEAYYKKVFAEGMGALGQQQWAEAEEALDEAQALFWDEDRLVHWAEAVARQGRRDEAYKALEEANGQNETAAFAEAAGLWADATERNRWFALALERDGHNELRYYYRVALTQGYEAEKLAALLKDYTALLAVNFHNTVLSSNPKYANLLYAWLSRQKLSPLYLKQIREDRQKFLEIWRGEEAKFKQLFPEFDL